MIYSTPQAYEIDKLDYQAERGMYSAYRRSLSDLLHDWRGTPQRHTIGNAVPHTHARTRISDVGRVMSVRSVSSARREVRTLNPYEANVFYVPGFTYGLLSNGGNPHEMTRRIIRYLQVRFLYIIEPPCQCVARDFVPRSLFSPLRHCSSMRADFPPIASRRRTTRSSGIGSGVQTTCSGSQVRVSSPLCCGAWRSRQLCAD